MLMKIVTFPFTAKQIELGKSLVPFLCVIYKTLIRLLAHGLQLLLVKTNIRIEFIMIKERVDEVSPSFDVGNLDFGEICQCSSS